MRTFILGFLGMGAGCMLVGFVLAGIFHVSKGRPIKSLNNCMEVEGMTICIITNKNVQEAE